MSLPKYEAVDRSDGFHADHWCIKILDGEYEGLVFQYDTVKFNPPANGEEYAADEETTLTFNTITVENPNNVNLTEENDKGIMGAILVDLIQQHLSELDKENNENGTPDTEQPST